MMIERINRKNNDAPKEPDRRKMILGTAAAAGIVLAAAVGGGILQEKWDEKEKMRTRIGKATVLEKIEKKGKKFTAGDVASEYMTDVGVYREGILGAAMDTYKTVQKGSEDKHFLSLKIADLPAFLAPVSETTYKNTERGSELEAEYSTTEDGKAIERIKDLKPSE